MDNGNWSYNKTETEVAKQIYINNNKKTKNMRTRQRVEEMGGGKERWASNNGVGGWSLGESPRVRGTVGVFKIEVSITELHIVGVAKDIKPPRPSVISDTYTNAFCEGFGGKSRKKDNRGTVLSSTTGSAQNQGMRSWNCVTGK